MSRWQLGSRRALLKGPAVAEGPLPDFVDQGLVMWLDATDYTTMTRTGSRVDEWRDKMGSGNKVATGAGGTSLNPSTNNSLNDGAGGVRFNRTSGHYLETPAAFTTMSWASGWTLLYAGIFRDVTPSYMASDSTRSIFGRGRQNRLGANTLWSSVSGVEYDEWNVTGARYTGSEYQSIIEGVASAVMDGPPPAGTGAFGKLQIGAWTPNTPTGNLDVAGFFIYNRALTDAELVRMTRWIRDNYVMNPAPITNRAFNIVADGNSLALGGLATAFWAVGDGVAGSSDGSISPRAYDLQVVARTGLTTPTMASTAAALVDPLLDTNYPASKRICIVWEISNHLANPTTTAEDAYNAIKAYCQARQLAGWKVLLVTCLPRSDAGLRSDFNELRAIVNDNIMINAETEGWADAVAPLHADESIGYDGASDNPGVYNADCFHLNGTGHEYAAPYIAAALSFIMTS